MLLFVVKASFHLQPVLQGKGQRHNSSYARKEGPTPDVNKQRTISGKIILITHQKIMIYMHRILCTYAQIYTNTPLHAHTHNGNIVVSNQIKVQKKLTDR